MPTISVDKYKLFEELGRKCVLLILSVYPALTEISYTTAEFEELCFEYGIELDEDTENEERPDGEPPQLKIEIPANRYDMLCFEGIAMNLKGFLGKEPIPNFRVVLPANGELHTISVSEDTMKVRPLIGGAILRNITFTQDSYDSFIALQDKLHQNLARQRTLVAIGTHDLDTVKPPFTYEALPPSEIEFIPLNQTKKMTAEQMMEFYDKDRHLGRYLHIIRDKPVYPVIYDSNRVLCSMPPIINGEHSKITLNTKSVFIEATATDATKLEIVINMMVTMFSVYCKEKFTIEPVKVLSNHNGQTRVVPNFSPRVDKVEVDYLNDCLGLTESPENICKLLEKMAYKAKPSTKDKNLIEVRIPPTRADILQRCDIMEDVGIAYGFNKLPRMSVNRTVGAPLSINKLTDIIRLECGMAGWSEVMPLILCSHDENFKFLNRKDDGKTAVRLANPKTAEYQIVRTSLLPGLLKTIRENKAHNLPIKVFEVSDVVFKNEQVERKATNVRHFAAAWCGKASGFEQVHGLLDRVMLMLRTAFITREEGLSSAASLERDGYWLEPIDEATFFQGRSAAIFLRIGGKAQRIGEIGILHPSVINNFELKYPISTLEVNVEVFL